jgi:hypothetical protein
MAVERLGVIFLVIAEEGAALREPAAVADQAVPVVVADLVAKVAEQRAVGFVHRDAATLAHRVVGLGEVDGDHAVGMTSEDCRMLFVDDRRIGEEVELQPSLGVDRLGDHRQPKGQETVDEPPLGDLQGVPGLMISRLGEVGDRLGEEARLAEGLLLVGGDGPVADVLLGVVLAEAVAAASRFGRLGSPEAVAGRFKGDDFTQLWQVGERAVAFDAAKVLEEDGPAAVVAVEESHGGECMRRACRAGSGEWEGFRVRGSGGFCLC